MSVDVVEKLQKQSVRQLHELMQGLFAFADQAISDDMAPIQALTQNVDKITMRFIEHMHGYFDEVVGKEVLKDSTVNFETLSLVLDEELEVMVALEGMVNHARNQRLSEYISFAPRLNFLLPDVKINESNNPLDPEQIAEAFQEAVRPLNLDAKATLAIYRIFNQSVLRNLSDVISAANQLMIDNNILPDLNMETSLPTPPQARNTKRAGSPDDESIEFTSFSTETEGPTADAEVEEVEEEEQEELFSVMQNLLHSETEDTASAEKTAPLVPDSAAPSNSDENTPQPENQGTVDLLADIMAVDGQSPVLSPLDSGPTQYAVPANLSGGAATGSAVMQAFTPPPGQKVRMVDQNQLLEVLTNIQKRLEAQDLLVRPPNVAEDGSVEPMEQLDISESLGELLQQGSESEDVVSAIDRHSSDIINLVTMLYEAIWQDEAVPIPIKELIGRTQITIIKVALSDTTFFDDEAHPARALLNEFASAGIGWNEVGQLEEDLLYVKMQELVHKILEDYEGDNDFFAEMLAEFKAFRTREASRERHLEKRILKAKQRQERMDDIKALVTQKIEERILGQKIDPFVRDLLDLHFHKFMVMLVLKEGPGSNAWKQSINTIDVLLWSVQPHSQEGDRGRLESINPRLLNNLRKACRIAGLEPGAINGLLNEFQEIQRASFPIEEITDSTRPDPFEDDDRSIEPVEQDRQTDSELDNKPPVNDPGATAEELSEDTLQSGEPDDESTPGAPTAKEQDQADAEAKSATDLANYMQQVEQLGVGVWVEFVGEEDHHVRCKLAAKINAIDKYIFVNRQGVKVVEKTKEGLAEELQDGTVRIVSEGLLFSRALESVIGSLREKQDEQQTGNAYQPDEAENV